MKENTKKYVKLSIILYIVILSVALVGTLAWFVFKQSATITTEKNSKIVAGEYLEICIDNGEDKWVTDMKLADPVQYPDVSVTPDGTVWYPISLDEGDQLFTGEKGKGVYDNVTEKEGYFLKLNLKVRASKGLDVYLHSDSYIEGVNMDKTDANKMFSKDAIAGAARVGFFDEEGLKTIWVPNEKFQLLSDENGVNGFEFDGEAEGEYKYLNVVDETVNAGNEYLEWDPNKITVGDNVLASDNSINEAKPLLSFSDAGEQKLTVYVWVEGTDREANTVLSGGSIKFNLKLVGVLPKALASENADLDINAVEFNKADGSFTYNGEEMGNEILYGFDADAVSTPYAPGDPNLASVGAGSKLYIRTAETKDYYLGEIREITVE